MNRRDRRLDTKRISSVDSGKAKTVADEYEMKLKSMPRDLIKRFRVLRDSGVTAENKFNTFVKHLIEDELNRLEKLERERR